MKKQIIGISFFILAALLASLFDYLDGFRYRSRQINGVAIDMLDVGQGDASLLTFTDGTQMLIDCGVDSRVLRSLGKAMKPFDRKIEYLVVTHPDNDHYGGCIDVLKKYEVNKVYYNGLKKTGDDYWRYYWDTVQANGGYNEVYETGSMKIGSSTVEILYPDHKIYEDKKVPWQSKSTGDNDTSIIIKVSYGESSALFTGDAESALEEYLVKKYGDKLRAKVLKVGHHGSGSSSKEIFLTAVRPEYSLISVGKENSYGHPSERVLRRLKRVGSQIFRTDLQGNVRVVLEIDKIFVP